MLDTSQIWLVRSGHRILGPFNQDEVESLLMEREIVVLDEISLPESRWKYIRDVREFSTVVEELRVQHLKNDDMTKTTPLETLTGSLTEPIDLNGGVDDLTDDINLYTSKKTEAVFQSELNDKIRGGTDSHYQMSNQAERVVKMNVQKATKKLWYATGAILVAVVAVVVFQKVVSKNITREVDFARLKEVGIAAAKMGDFDLALKNLQRANEIEPADFEIFRYLGPLKIQMLGLTGEGRRMLKLVLQNSKQGRHSILTGLGLADLFEERYESAIDHFNKALELKSNYAPAIANLGSTHSRLGNKRQAKKFFDRALIKGGDDDVVYLLAANNLISMWWQDQDRTEFLDQAQRYLKDSFHRTQSYDQESFLMLTYIDVLRGQISAAKSKISKTLDIDPIQTKNFQKHVFIYREPIGWKNLVKKCEQISQSFGSYPMAKALLGYCYFREGSIIKAKEIIDNANSMDYKNPVIRSILASIFYERDQVQLASSELNRAMEYNSEDKFMLPLILLARIHTENKSDLKKALQLWQKVRDRDANNLAAVVGMGQIFLEKNQTEKFMKIAIEANAIDSKREYLPLLRLHKSARERGIEVQ